MTEDAVTVRPGALRGMTVNAPQIPDLVPVLSVVAAFAEGETRFINAGRLRIKESDRLATTRQLLEDLGADVEENSRRTRRARTHGASGRRMRRHERPPHRDVRSRRGCSHLHTRRHQGRTGRSQIVFRLFRRLCPPRRTGLSGGLIMPYSGRNIRTGRLRPEPCGRHRRDDRRAACGRSRRCGRARGLHGQKGARAEPHDDAAKGSRQARDPLRHRRRAHLRGARRRCRRGSGACRCVVRRFCSGDEGLEAQPHRRLRPQARGQQAWLCTNGRPCPCPKWAWMSPERPVRRGGQSRRKKSGINCERPVRPWGLTTASKHPRRLRTSRCGGLSCRRMRLPRVRARQSVGNFLKLRAEVSRSCRVVARRSLSLMRRRPALMKQSRPRRRPARPREPDEVGDLGRVSCHAAKRPEHRHGVFRQGNLPRRKACESSRPPGPLAGVCTKPVGVTPLPQSARAEPEGAVRPVAFNSAAPGLLSRSSPSTWSVRPSSLRVILAPKARVRQA